MNINNLGRGIKRIALKKYPNEPYSIFELPVRKNKKYYQVWNGERWYKLNIIYLKK